MIIMMFHRNFSISKGSIKNAAIVEIVLSEISCSWRFKINTTANVTSINTADSEKLSKIICKGARPFLSII